MIKWIRASYKRQLLANILVAALLPLLISAAFLIRFMRMSVDAAAQNKVDEQMLIIEEDLLDFFADMDEVAETVESDSVVTSRLTTTDDEERSEAYYAFYADTSRFRQLAQFNLFDADGYCRYSTGSTVISGRDTQGDVSKDNRALTYWGAFKMAADNPGELVFRRGNDFGTDESVIFHGVKALRDSKGEIFGYFSVDMNETNFETLLKDNVEAASGISILDSQWEEIYSSGMAKHENLAGLFRNYLMGEGETSVNWGKLRVREVGRSGLCLIMNPQEIFSSDVLDVMYTVLFVMLFLSTGLCVLIANNLSNNLSLPIKRMNKAMHMLQDGDMSARIAIDRDDEIGQLSQNFNIMASEITDYMEEKVSRQKEINKSQIAMMQAQLNPHFLYNTLDTMKWVAKANNVPEIATLASGLAKILRTSISAGQFITLKQELELVQNYINIQQIRFSGRFDYTANCPEDLYKCIVPKLMIQPSVENAIIHGFKESEEGSISVDIIREEDLIISISDNGCGIGEDMMEALNSHSLPVMSGHIGFVNVDSIIRLNYGEEYGLHVERLDEGGTRVVIRMPYMLEIPHG